MRRVFSLALALTGALVISAGISGAGASSRHRLKSGRAFKSRARQRAVYQIFTKIGPPSPSAGLR
jgi:hypothetical protein